MSDRYTTHVLAEWTAEQPRYSRPRVLARIVVEQDHTDPDDYSGEIRLERRIEPPKGTDPKGWQLVGGVGVDDLRTLSMFSDPP